MLGFCGLWHCVLFFIGFYETPLLFVILCWGLVVCPIMFCAGTMVQHLLWQNVVWSMLFVIIRFKWKFVLCWNCVEIGCARTVILHNFLSMMACGNCKKVLPVCSLRILTFCPHHLVALILAPLQIWCWNTNSMLTATDAN